MAPRWALSPSAAAADAKPIVIGASMSLSGAYAAGGRYSLEGTRVDRRVHLRRDAVGSQHAGGSRRGSSHGDEPSLS
jgi:hypothetical protein